jgi:parallel beta-helix repeat protein
MKSARVSSCSILVLGLALASTPVAATAKSITVNPGQSIQAAVNTARPGDTVKVLSGDYCEPNPGAAAVRITKPLKLMASGQVRILPCGGQPNGIVVEPAKPGDPDIDGIEIIGFTVQGFEHNGIWLAHVNHFNIENNVSIDNLENGIWPTLSANGQVKKNVAYGSTDSALWVEASQNVRVINNDLHNSPTGLEVTISKNVTIENNEIHHNTVGIGLYHPAAAGLPQKEWPAGPYGDWHVANNYVHDNNEPNTATGGEVALLPPGLGMLILGVDRVDVQQNRIEKNDFVGVGMIDWCVALGDPGCQNSEIPPGFEDTALDYIQIVGNRFADNHAGTPPPGPFETLGSDILYVGADYFASFLPAGTNNCQSDNKLIKTPAAKDAAALIIALPDGALPMCESGGHDGGGHDGGGHDGGGHDGGGHDGGGHDGGGGHEGH